MSFGTNLTQKAQKEPPFVLLKVAQLKEAHIEYRCRHSSCEAAPVMPQCASAVLPPVRSPQRTLSIWQVLAEQVLIFMGQMQSAVAV